MSCIMFFCPAFNFLSFDSVCSPLVIYFSNNRIVVCNLYKKSNNNCCILEITLYNVPVNLVKLFHYNYISKEKYCVARIAVEKRGNRLMVLPETTCQFEYTEKRREFSVWPRFVCLSDSCFDSCFPL